MDRARRWWHARRGTYRAVFGTPQGEIVLRDLMKAGGMHRLSFDPRNPDPQATAFNEGKRFMARHVADMMRLSPERIEQLCQDQAETAEWGED